MPDVVVPHVVVLAVVVSLLPLLGHGAGGVAPAQELTPGTGRAARNAALLRTLQAISRSRN